MKIRIHKLKFANVFSYGEDNEVIFDDAAVTQLIGHNGAGKSSIPIILEEGLFNKNSRGIKKGDILNRYSGADSYSISVEFYVDSVKYVLDKAVKSTTKVKLTKDGEDISGHTATQTYKEVENILGLSFASFTKLINQSMISSLDFLQATDGDRKKFLIEMFNFDKYTELHKIVKDTLSEVKKEVASLETRCSGAKDFLSRHPEDIKVLELPLEPSDNSEELYTAKAELNAKLSSYEADKRAAKRYLEASQAVQNEKDKLNELEEMSVLEPIMSLTDRTRLLVELRNNSNELSSEIKHLTTNINQLKAGVGFCSSCGQSLPNSEESEKHVKDLVLQLEVQKAKQEKVDSELREVLQDQKKADSVDYHKNQIVAQKEALRKAQEFLASLDKPDETLIEPTEAKAGIRDIDAQLQEIQKNKKHYQDTLSKVSTNNAKAEVVNAERKVRSEELTKLTKELTLEQNRLGRLTILEKALGPKGIVQYKIEQSIKVFEELINHYLSKLSMGVFALRFEIEDSKLKVVLFQEGKEISIKSASSGEINNINTSTLLAVRKLMSSISKTHINLLFLDEVISVLDEGAKENLISILLGETELNTMIVSHGFTHPLADVLHVSKVDRISTICKE